MKISSLLMLGLSLAASPALAAPADQVLTAAEVKSLLTARARDTKNADPLTYKYQLGSCGIDLAKQVVVPNDRVKAKYEKVLASLEQPSGGEFAETFKHVKESCGVQPQYKVDFAVAVDAEENYPPVADISDGFWLACTDGAKAADYKAFMQKVKLVHLRLQKDMNAHNSPDKYSGDHYIYEFDNKTGKLTVYVKKNGIQVGMMSARTKEWMEKQLGK